MLEENTFRECKRLRSVKFPDRLEKICIAAFYGSGIESATFPASLRTISQTSFCLCPGLRSVKFGEGLEALGTRTYQDSDRILYGVFGGSALEHVELPSTLRRIEYNAFNDCANLTSIALPERLEYIGRLSFQNSGLREFVAPPGLKEIDGGAFNLCKSLKRVTLNEGLEALRDYQNSGNYYGALAWTGIEEVTLPSTLRQIDRFVLSDCDSLKKVYVKRGCKADLFQLRTPSSAKIVRLSE